MTPVTPAPPQSQQTDSFTEQQQKNLGVSRNNFQSITQPKAKAYAAHSTLFCYRSLIGHLSSNTQKDQMHAYLKQFQKDLPELEKAIDEGSVVQIKSFNELKDEILRHNGN